jgi:Flp pilus assembly protein TadD
MARVCSQPALVLLLGCFLGTGLTGSALAASRRAKPKPAGPVVSVQTQKMTKAAAKHLTKARALREKGKNDLAIAEYRQALTIDPSSAEAALELGGLYYELDLFQPCAEILEAALPMAESQGYDDHTLGEAYCQLARSQVANGAPDRANAALLKAAQLIPDDPRPHLILGELQAARERFDEAFQAFRRALKLDPQLIEAWSAMGRLALQTRRAKEASEVLQGLQQADSLKAKAFHEAMAAARLDVVAVPPPPPPPAPTADPYADDSPPPPAASPKTGSSGNAPQAPAPQPSAPSTTPSSSRPAPIQGVRPPGPSSPPGASTTNHTPQAGSRVDTQGSRRTPTEATEATDPGQEDAADHTDEATGNGEADDPYGDQTGISGQSSARGPAGSNAPAAAPASRAAGPLTPSTSGPRAAGQGSAPPPAAPTGPSPAPGPASAAAPAVQVGLDEAMARFLSDDDATAAQGKADLLALGAPAIPRLAEKLADPDPNLRRRTLRLLGEFGPTAKPAFSAVEEALADPDPGVVEAAQDALDRIGAD